MKEKNDKKRVDLIDYSKSLKQQKSYSCVMQPNFLVPLLWITELLLTSHCQK